MRLAKHHGLGNDFLVVLDDAGLDVGSLTDDPGARGRLARALCDRRRGIGADGLIVGTALGAPEGVDVVMHLHNADGSRAEISGNGIRCLGHAVARQRGTAEGTVVVETDAGRRSLRVSTGEAPNEVTVEVAMGEVAAAGDVPAAALELLAGRPHAHLDVGNPHLVVEVADPAQIDLEVEGPALEAAFPDGVNVEFVSVAADAAARPRIDLRVWERGAGITEACGSGACAATRAARDWGRLTDEADVAMPGGSASVRLDGDTAVLTGPSVLVADVEVPDDVVRRHLEVAREPTPA